MTQHLILLGILLIFLGFFLVIMGSLLHASKEEWKVSVGVGGFIGPIPFGFANNREMLYLVMAFTAVALVFFFLLSRNF